MQNPDLSIVVPCFNPPDGWLEKLEHNAQFLKSKNISFELIIVNDGSKNPLQADLQTRLDAIGKNAIIAYPMNMGKGFAVRKGVECANAAMIIYTDVDFPYKEENLLDVFEKIKNGSDVVIGVRSESYYNTLPKLRVAISKLLRFAISFMMQIPTDDTQCGLKGFNQKGKEVFLSGKINRYLFDMEFVKLAARKKLTITTTVVHLRHGVVMAQMPIGLLFKEAMNFLRILFV